MDLCDQLEKHLHKFNEKYSKVSQKSVSFKTTKQKKKKPFIYLTI